MREEIKKEIEVFINKSDIYFARKHHKDIFWKAIDLSIQKTRDLLFMKNGEELRNIKIAILKYETAKRSSEESFEELLKFTEEIKPN